MVDPLLPHLIDIAEDRASEGLILAGGFGLRLKQNALIENGEQTLIAEVPDARATQDLDFFLRMELFVKKEKGKAVRALLDRLSYVEYNPQWQFGKAEGQGTSGRQIKVDLLARHPDIADGVKVRGDRVGSGSNIGLHGRDTPEAFAIEDEPQRLHVRGQRTDGQQVDVSLYVPHPYAWLHMKVAAAYEWLAMARSDKPPKKNSEKHVFDVYVIIAMLTRDEVNSATVMAAKYSKHPQARQNQERAAQLFDSPEAQAFLEVARQMNGLLTDYETFWEGLKRAMGIL